MRAFRVAVLTGLLSHIGLAQSYTINTLAGGGLPASLPGTSASLGAIGAVAVDPHGNLLIASTSFGAVFRLDRQTGILTVAAGNGTLGYSGDGGLATSAQLYAPSGLAVDAGGNTYIADKFDQSIRKVSPTGIITTIAGNGIGPRLFFPSGVAVDASDDVYFADTGNNVIRMLSNGVMTIVAGNGTQGYTGDGGLATSAELYSPSGLAVDAAGSLYIADSGNHRVRKVSNGVISTVAGNGTNGFGGDNGPAINAQLAQPTSVAVDPAGDLYIADFISPSFTGIREVSNGVITTVVGGGTILGDGGSALMAQVKHISGIALDPGSSGNLYLADLGDNRVRQVSSGVITTIAGNGTCCFNGDGGPATASGFATPYGVASDTSGNIFISDMLIASYGFIHQVSQGLITTVAGSEPSVSGCVNGPAAEAEPTPVGIAVDSTGNLFVADTFNRCIREVSGATITTIAGNGNASFGGDGGPATRAAMYNPAGVAVDSTGSVYIADTGNSRIRKVSKGVITTVVGTGVVGFGGDGGPAAEAQLAAPFGIAVDASDNLYIADSYNNRIRKVSGGVITTLAGNGLVGYFGDNGPAIRAALDQPYGVAVDSAGNVYIADTFNSRIRKVTPTGTITTIAGSGATSFSGDGGPAEAAALNGPYGVAVDEQGRVYIADTNNNRIRVLTPSGLLTVTSVNNAASNLAGPVAPGEIVVLTGAGLGPSALVSAQIASNGLYDPQLSGASVQFNGIAAPLLYASATQLAAVVPYEIGGSTARVTLTYQGQTSIPVVVPIAASAPGLFTLDSTGKGQAAAVNQDGSINSSSAPAPLGSLISLYATGEGQTNPSGVNGKPGSVPLPQPTLPVSVTIGGQTVSGVRLQYAGGVLGDVAGLLQINVPVPASLAPSNAVPVTIQIGTASSQSGVTIAVTGGTPSSMSR